MCMYRGTSLIRNSAPLGPYSRTIPRTIRWSESGVLVRMNEEPLLLGRASVGRKKITARLWP